MKLRDDQIETIDKLSSVAHRPLLSRLAKLTEEAGEVAGAIQSYEEELGCNYKDKTVDDVKEEVVDTLLVLYSMLSDLEVTPEEFQSIVDKKIEKWAKVTGNA